MYLGRRIAVPRCEIVFCGEAPPPGDRRPQVQEEIFQRGPTPLGLTPTKATPLHPPYPATPSQTLWWGLETLLAGNRPQCNVDV